MTDVRTNSELTAATASGLRWTTTLRVLTELLLLASMIVLARLIPPSAFGMFAVAMIVQELAVNVPSEGVGSAMVQRKTVGREHLEGGLAFALLIAAALAAFTLVLAQVLVRPLFGDETALLIALTTPWFLFGAIVALPMTVLRRRLDFRRLSLLGFVQSIVRSVSTILFAAVLGLDAEALVLGGLVAMASMVAVALVFAPVPLPRWRPQAVRELLPYGGPAMLACFSWAGFRNGDYAIVNARLGAADAGFYFRAFQLSVEYQGKISAVMGQVAFPVMSRTSSPEEMFALRQRMVRLLTVVLFPVLTLLALLAPVIVPWLFGPAWEPAVLPTQILAGAGAATVVIDAVGVVLMAEGRTRAMLGYGVAHFAIYAGAVLVASSHGLAAVSGAAVGVHAIFVVVAYRLMLRDRGEPTLRFLWNDVAAAAVSCVVLVAVAAPVDMALDDAGVLAPLHLLAVGAVGTLAYLATVRLAFPGAWQDVRAVLRRVVPLTKLPAVARKLRAAAAVHRA